MFQLMFTMDWLAAVEDTAQYSMLFMTNKGDVMERAVGLGVKYWAVQDVVPAVPEVSVRLSPLVTPWPTG